MKKEFKNITISLEHIGANWYVVCRSFGSVLYPPHPHKTKKSALDTFNKICAIQEEEEKNE